MKRTVDHIRDELLVLQCQAGDAKSFAELVGRWHGRLMRHVKRLTEGHEDSADLMQDVWMTVARKLRKLDDPAAFPYWAYRIATARCADWVRKRARDRRMKSELESDPPQVDNHAGESTDLKRAIAQLPSDQKIVLTMFYLDEMPVAAIAVALDIPAGTVKSRLYHARNHLRTIIERSES